MNAIRPYLYIGGIRDVQSAPLLRECGITATLLLSENIAYPGIASLYLPIEDGSSLTTETLEDGIQFARQQIAEGGIVLVACALGISRSATFATAILREQENLPLAEAFRVVKEARIEARPHPTLWESLCQYCGEEVPYSVLLKRNRQNLPNSS